MIDNNINSNVIEAIDLFLKMPERERVKYLAEKDCIYFGEQYIKPYDKKWTSKTADVHRDMIDAAQRHKFCQYHVPFEHAKTTWISIVFPLWLIAKNHSYQILLVSSTPKLVGKCLSLIEWHILHNKKYKADFGVRKSEAINKWTDTAIYIDREGASKDPTIEVVGMHGQVLGGRFDFIIGDDVCDRHNMNTVGLRDKAEDWWLTDIHSRLAADGHIINIGTVQKEDDLGIRLSKNKKYFYIQRKAIENEEKKQTLWPDKYSYNDLVKIRETIGTIRFNRSYQNDIETFKGRLLDPKWLQYYDENSIKTNELKIYFGIDPDIADENDLGRINSDHCWFVIAVLGWHPIRNKVYILETYYGVHSFTQQCRIINDYYDIYYPLKIAVEQNFYQKALKQQLTLEGLPMVGVTSNKNKIERIEARAVDYEIGRLLASKSQSELRTEWDHFGDPKYKNDVLDAIDIGMKVIPIRSKRQVVTGGVIA